MQLAGKLPVSVRFKGKEAHLNLYVVTGAGASVLGRDWFSAFDIKVSGVHAVSPRTLNDIIAKHDKVFKGTLNGHVGTPLHIDLNQEATPKFLKCRPVPSLYGLRYTRSWTNFKLRTFWSQ
ncbi:hypothetical protein HPB47_000617 [Ixodes persulcatus]|uniref:Uncharacterized protein n=1 Tax=Ixodes persulcatus TaxID=34615 RepID=A0AC60PRF6_IXOPE|nr:hypothetical protein HPB47_000617 [Ixodes persulcatus]